MGALISGHVLALIAMIVGTILLIVEMYIPSFGIAGISGIVLSAAGLIAMGGSAVQTLILAGCELALLGVALAICVHTASKGRFAKSRLVLRDVSVQKSDENADLLGKMGRTETPLRPSGIAVIEGRRVSVITEGEFVDANADVTVVYAAGNRIVVKSAK